VFLAGLFRAEQNIAERLIRVASGKLPWPPIDASRAIAWVEERNRLRLADSQRDAIRLALVSKALVITGGPGVGKTTIVNSILRILGVKGVRMLLCAPTGRAAKRMTEATGIEAKTIHRLLEVDPKTGGFKRNEGNCLDCDLLVLDEASMVDVLLMQALLKAVPDQAALIIVGDIDQLPSGWPGAGSRGCDRIGSSASRAPGGSLSTGGGEPDHRQRPSDQPGLIGPSPSAPPTGGEPRKRSKAERGRGTGSGHAQTLRTLAIAGLVMALDAFVVAPLFERS